LINGLLPFVSQAGEGGAPFAALAPAAPPRVGIASAASFTYAAMGVLHATIDAALQLRSKDKVAAGQIGRIDVDMPQTEGCGPIRRSAGELPPH
jgi:2-methylcitrate dehydratase PrpD